MKEGSGFNTQTLAMSNAVYHQKEDKLLQKYIEKRLVVELHYVKFQNKNTGQTQNFILPATGFGVLNIIPHFQATTKNVVVQGDLFLLVLEGAG